MLTVEFLAKQNEPVLLQDTTFFLLLQNLSLNMNGVLALTALTGVLLWQTWETASTIGLEECLALFH
jgi:hypothetical protein